MKFSSRTIEPRKFFNLHSQFSTAMLHYDNKGTSSWKIVSNNRTNIFNLTLFSPNLIKRNRIRNIRNKHKFTHAKLHIRKFVAEIIDICLQITCGNTILCYQSTTVSSSLMIAFYLPPCGEFLSYMSYLFHLFSLIFLNSILLTPT